MSRFQVSEQYTKFSSLYLHLARTKRFWRILVLFFLSQVIFTSQFRRRLLSLFTSDKSKNLSAEFSKKFASIFGLSIQKTQKSSLKSKQFPLVPEAKPPKNWFLGLFLGHFADIGLEKKDLVIVKEIFRKREDWYEDVEAQSKQSKSVRVRLFTDEMIFTHDLDLIRAINGQEDGLFRNSDVISKNWGRLFPNSMTVVRGEKWKRVRRVFVSAIRKLDFASLPPSTYTTLKTGFNNYIKSDVQEVNLWDLFSKVTFDSFHKFAYDIDFNCVSGENLGVLKACTEIATAVANRMFVNFPFVWYLPTKTNRSLKRAHGKLCKFVESFIEKRTKLLKEGPPSETGKVLNLLDALILASFEEAKSEQRRKQKRLTKGELRDQLAAAMFGGFDTTSSSISIILSFLTNRPDVQQRLYEEVKSVDLSNATDATLGNLVYLNSVIKETMRIQAVAPGVVRIPNQDVVVNGFLIKEGTNILIDHEKMGSVPELWKDSDDLFHFNPDRWVNFTPEMLSFVPFGFGGRSCPGQKVANIQLQIILTFLSQNFVLSPSDKPIKIITTLGRTLARDSTVIFTRRN